MMTRGNLLRGVGAALFCSTLLPPLISASSCAAAARRAFGAQFPDALDIIVRSLRAGHPVPIADHHGRRAKCRIRSAPNSASSPTRSPTAPISKPRCAISISASARTICRCSSPRWQFRVRPAAISAKFSKTCRRVIRLRFKMRRKIRALASEGRASAMILSSLPIVMFLIVQVITPDFYASVWHEDMTKIALACAGGWMGIGNFIMYQHGELQDLNAMRISSSATQLDRWSALLVFLAAGTLAFCDDGAHPRAELGEAPHRRHLGAGECRVAGSRSLRHSSMKAAARVSSTTRRSITPTAATKRPRCCGAA